MTRNLTLAALLITMTLASCGPGAPGIHEEEDAIRISLTDPSTQHGIPIQGETTVPVGQAVLWVNDDRSDHTVTSPEGLWDSGRIRPGERFLRRFDKPGNYDFTSVFNREIEGVIHVVE